MASIYKEFTINAPAAFVWDAVKDVGALHERLAKGFVVNTALDGHVRAVAFSNGTIVREFILAVDEDQLRLAYTIIGGRPTHHNASFQVVPMAEEQCLMLWITDLLPEELRIAFEQMVNAGASAMQETLESAYHASKPPRAPTGKPRSG